MSRILNLNKSNIVSITQMMQKAFALILASLMVLTASAAPVSAQPAEVCNEKQLRDKGIAIINCVGGNSCSVGGTGSTTSTRIAEGSTVYVLGDSITVGMRDAGDLAGKMTAAGLTPSRINAVGGEDLGWGQDQLTADNAVLSGVRAVVIGLGTNNIGTVVTNDSDDPSRAIDGGQEVLERTIQGMINTINPVGVAAKKQIFWTTVNIKGTLSTSNGDYNMDIAMPIINAAIKKVAAANGVTIVPWDTYDQASIWISADGIHPSGRYPDMATWLVNSLTSSGTQAPSTQAPSTGCACALSVGAGGDRDSRYRTAWAFFTDTKGLSTGAAAGIMGNLEAESGIDPQNTQNNAPAPDGPEIPIDAIRGRFGYGIAQWTSAGRQDNLIRYAAETNRSTGDLGLQLDFLWKELTESYVGVAAVLQTPNVTLEEASFTFLSEYEIPLPFTNSGTQAQRDAETENRRAMSQAIFDEFSGQSISGGGSAGCNSDGSVIDLTSTDTTAVPCGPGSTDAGLADGYRDGQLIKIRLCTVGGTRVNSQISGGVARLLTDSAAAGVSLSINGSFRNMDAQIAIYNSWCSRGGITPTPPPYPKASWRDYTNCPGGAPPGYSNHQAGLALDFDCDGILMPMSYAEGSTNRCFQWLSVNAIRYGLYEFGKGQERQSAGYESWHWSVDGN